MRKISFCLAFSIASYPDTACITVILSLDRYAFTSNLLACISSTTRTVLSLRFPNGANLASLILLYTKIINYYAKYISSSEHSKSNAQYNLVHV